MKKMNRISHLVFFAGFCLGAFAQEGAVSNLIYEGNEKANNKEFLQAEVDYRMALSKAPERNEALHNLGNIHFENEHFDEASQRYFQAQKFASSKADKHLAFHNMGNVFMKKKDYAKAVEAYKNALRNNPTDDETRYNYALAKELLEKEKQQQQQDEQQDQDKQNQEQEQENEKQDNQGDQDQNEESDQKDKGEEGEQEKQEGDPEEKKGDQSPQSGNPDQQEKRPPPPRQGQLSPQQVQSLLEAMNNQEKDVQEKVNAKKVNAVPVRRKKDW
jgi:tetratricopeptide (TPR) repeat protein